MFYSSYHSPLGALLLAADEVGLTGIWFAGQKYFASTLSSDAVEQEMPILSLTKTWLDNYFAGKHSTPPSLHLIGTPFQVKVWQALIGIPYGETRTYGNLARALKTAPRAVGAAVSRNPISLIVPCHRVVGSKQSLTGYAAGLERKSWLLKLERSWS